MDFIQEGFIRAFALLVNRDPAMVQVFDTSLGEDGYPKNLFLRGVEICPQASTVTVADLGKVEGVGAARAEQLRSYFDRLLEVGMAWRFEDDGRL